MKKIILVYIFMSSFVAMSQKVTIDTIAIKNINVEQVLSSHIKTTQSTGNQMPATTFSRRDQELLDKDIFKKNQKIICS